VYLDYDRSNLPRASSDVTREEALFLGDVALADTVKTFVVVPGGTVKYHPQVRFWTFSPNQSSDAASSFGVTGYGCRTP
jgi:hypothetical protein